MDNFIDSDVEKKRLNMIEGQIRPWKVSDHRVLDALRCVKREFFVPDAMRTFAFSDLGLPLKTSGIDTHEKMLTPKLEARLIQELQLGPADSALEIGTGSGYQAALLGWLVNQVLSVEIHSQLSLLARENIRANRISNVIVKNGDGSEGWGSAQYDAILITGSVPVLPRKFKHQLKLGGRMVAVIGQHPVMTACRVTRHLGSRFQTDMLFETCVQPLKGVVAPQFNF